MFTQIVIWGCMEVYRSFKAHRETVAKKRPVAGPVGGLGIPRLVLSVPNPSLSPAELQAELVELLDGPTEPDPFDFSGYAEQWAGIEGITIESPDDVLDDDDLRERFAAWLHESNVAAHVIMNYPYDVPARYHFDKAEALPAGTWLLHHTDAHIARFDRGATADTMALTGPKKAKAPPDNTDERHGSWERVFSFAFQADCSDPCVNRNGRFSCGGRGAAYGRNMALFQTDAAVSAYHHGDQEHQAIFAAGTEYNLHNIYGESSGQWAWESPAGETFRFDTLDDMTNFFEQQREAQTG